MLQDREMVSPAALASSWVNFFEHQLDRGPEWESAREAFYVKFPYMLSALIREIACEVERVDTLEAHHAASVLLAIKISHYLGLFLLVVLGITSPG